MNEESNCEQIWQEIENGLFGVLGMVTARNEARTVGIVYIVRGRRLYIASDRDAWKVKHIARNPHVSVTIPIHKAVPLMPWFKIPAATITFPGVARVLELDDVPPELIRTIFRGIADSQELMAGSCLIEVEPVGDFVTYGVGVPLMKMRHPEQARGRAPVAAQEERV